MIVEGGLFILIGMEFSILQLSLDDSRGRNETLLYPEVLYEQQ